MTATHSAPTSLRTPTEDRVLLAVFGAFTLVAVLGYGTFGRHPGLLEGYPSLMAFYNVSFGLFAQAQVWLAGIVLAWLLVRRTGAAWLPLLGVVYLLSLGSELAGTTFGVHFGAYYYTDLLGPMWFGKVPWLIPLSWFLMALPAYALARAAFPASRAACIAFGAWIFTTWDLALDPAMSFLTPYWKWLEHGPYYGMPLINLFGWYATALFLMAAFAFLDGDRWVRRLPLGWLAAYYALTLAMPLGMVLAGGLWGAGAVTLASAGACVWLLHVRGVRFDEQPPAAPGVRAGAPPAPAPQPAELEAADAFFRVHSRSFSFAARWFSPDVRPLVTALYAFCRTTDDIVDRQVGRPRADVEAALDDWIATARAAYDGRPSGIPWLDRIMAASAASGTPFSIIEDLAAGVRMDIGRVALQTTHELDLYAYRVASTVGLWLCHLHGISDPEVLCRAAAMGRAMQLTNILRDVGEDLRHDRVYLPADLLARHGLDRPALERMAAGAPPDPAYHCLLADLMARADADYDFAFAGLAALPEGFARAGAVAGEVYRGIHAVLRRSGFDNLSRRAYTRPHAKLWLAVRGLWRLRAVQRAQSPAPAPALLRSRVRARLAGLWMLALPLVPVGQPAAALPNFSAEAVARVSVETLRTWYLAAVTDADAIDRAQEAIAAIADPAPIVRAYDAAFEVLRAKHAAWPITKMKHLNRGLPALDALVKQRPDDAEIHYLRLLSCYYLPGFLGRGDTVREDFRALGRLLPAAREDFPPDLYRQMVRFVHDKGKLPAPDRRRLAAVLRAAEPTAQR